MYKTYEIEAIETIAQIWLIVVGILTHTPTDDFGVDRFTSLVFFLKKVCQRSLVNFVTRICR